MKTAKLSIQGYGVAVMGGSTSGQKDVLAGLTFISLINTCAFPDLSNQ
jgi:hypothetical protein